MGFVVFNLQQHDITNKSMLLLKLILQYKIIHYISGVISIYMINQNFNILNLNGQALCIFLKL